MRLHYFLLISLVLLGGSALDSVADDHLSKEQKEHMKKAIESTYHPARHGLKDLKATLQVTKTTKRMNRQQKKEGGAIYFWKAPDNQKIDWGDSDQLLKDQMFEKQAFYRGFINEPIQSDAISNVEVKEDTVVLEKEIEHASGKNQKERTTRVQFVFNKKDYRPLRLTVIPERRDPIGFQLETEAEGNEFLITGQTADFTASTRRGEADISITKEYKYTSVSTPEGSVKIPKKMHFKQSQEMTISAGRGSGKARKKSRTVSVTKNIELTLSDINVNQGLSDSVFEEKEAEKKGGKKAEEK